MAYLEPNAYQALKEIKEQKPKQCCFKERLVDGFVIGATRAYGTGRIPKGIDQKRRSNINLDELVDSSSKLPRSKIEFILKLIAYSHMIDQTGKDEKKRDKIHEILIDKARWVKIAERYFKGGWEIPDKDNFKEISYSDFPDSKIIEELF